MFLFPVGALRAFCRRSVYISVNFPLRRCIYVALESKGDPLQAQSYCPRHPLQETIIELLKGHQRSEFQRRVGIPRVGPKTEIGKLLLSKTKVVFQSPLFREDDLLMVYLKQYFKAKGREGFATTHVGVQGIGSRRTPTNLADPKEIIGPHMGRPGCRSRII